MIIKENAAFKSSKEKSASIHQRREREKKKKSNFKNRLLVKRKKFISDFIFTFTTIFFHNFSNI